jgi:hypothetical protein
MYMPEHDIPNNKRTARVLWSRPQTLSTGATSILTSPDHVNSHIAANGKQLISGRGSVYDAEVDPKVLANLDDDGDRTRRHSMSSSDMTGSTFRNQDSLESLERCLSEYASRAPISTYHGKSQDEVDAMLMELKWSSSASTVERQSSSSPYKGKPATSMHPHEQARRCSLSQGSRAPDVFLAAAAGVSRGQGACGTAQPGTGPTDGYAPRAVRAVRRVSLSQWMVEGT